MLTSRSSHSVILQIAPFLESVGAFQCKLYGESDTDAKVASPTEVKSILVTVGVTMMRSGNGATGTAVHTPTESWTLFLPGDAQFQGFDNQMHILSSHFCTDSYYQTKPG